MKRALVAIALFALSAVAGMVTAQPAPDSAVRARARHRGITDDLECSACHTPAGWSVDGDGGGFDHARTGFPLAGRHRLAACAECHQERRALGRQCVICHDDQHRGQLGRDCARCHDAVAWTSTRDLEIHRLTRLPLTGMHAIAACTDCHRRTEDRVYSAVPAECIACHEDEYRAPGTHPDHVAAGYSRACAECHRTTGWSPAILDPSSTGRTSMGLRAPARHELRFPIARGPHRGAPCASCHEDAQFPAAVRCDGCHAHGPSALRRQHRSAVPASDGRACLGCHPGGAAR